METNTNNPSLESLEKAIKKLALKCSSMTLGIQLGAGATHEERFVNYLKDHCEKSKQLDEFMTTKIWMLSSMLRTLLTFAFESVGDDEQMKQHVKKTFFDSIPKNALILLILYGKLYVFKGDEVLKNVQIDITEKEIQELIRMNNDQIFEQLME
jgi:hypothetical protein